MLILISIFSVIYSQPPSYLRQLGVTPELNITYTLNCSIPYPPSKVPALWLNITYASEEEALHLLEELTGLEPTSVTVNENDYYIKTDKGRLLGDAVNDFMFIRIDSEGRKAVQDMERVEEIAEEFKDKIVALLPDTGLKLVRSPIEVGSTSIGPNGETIIRTHRISYYGYYKGVKVGQARIRLSICNDEVFEFSVHLPQVWDLGYFIPIHTSEYALDRFMLDDVDTRDYSVRMPSAQDAIRSIDEFELAYHQGHFVDRNGFTSEVFYVIRGHEYNPPYNMHCEYSEYVRANIEK